MPRNPLKISFLKILFLIYILIPFYLWYSTSPTTTYSIGRFLGIIMLSLVALQPVLSGRIKFLERGVGHDRLMHWHSINAKVVTLMIFIHPSLLFFNYISRGISPLEISAFYNTTGFYLAYIILFSLVVIIITSLFTTKIKLDYEVWKKIHLLTYIVVFGGFIHSFLIGSTISDAPLLYWWVLLLVLAISAVFNRYVLSKLHRQKYEIIDLVEEVEGVHSIYLKPSSGDKLKYNAGQFLFTKFISKSLPGEEHHFTISSAPSDDHLQFTIKSLGDFTSQIGKLRKGEQILVEGPFGAFSNENSKGPFLFIAGGIGITPIRSMLREMVAKNRKDKSVLLYSASSKKELVFYDELRSLTKNKWFSASLLDRRIEENDIKQAITELGSTPKVYLVGPVAMMKDIEKMLNKMGISKRNIDTEKFALK